MVSTLSNPEPYERQIKANLVLGWKPVDILKADGEQLLVMQHRLGLGKTWGAIEFPESFMPEGNLQYPSVRILKLPQFIPKGLTSDDPSAILAWTEVLRFTVSRLTIAGPRCNTAAGYSTCAINIGILKQFVRKILEKPMRGGYFWSLVGEDEFTGTVGHKKLICLIRHFQRVGAIPDSVCQIESIEGDAIERDRESEPEHQEPVDENKRWQPLPMVFVAEAGWRSLRVVSSVAPTLLDALEAAVQVRVTHGEMGTLPRQKGSRDRTVTARNRVIAGWHWRDEKGESLDTLGFDFQIKVTANGSGSKNTAVDLQWPPRTFAEAFTFLHTIVKPAHLWMVLLGNGPRNSEAISMRTNCLTPAATGNFAWKGRTYKMAGITGGREITVVVPQLIGQSILQQIRLAELTRQVKGWNGDALWVGEKDQKLVSLNHSLNRYVQCLGLGHLLGKDNPSCHEHRFRKTLARLVALALTNSIMILKDCFGHTDAVMTLLSYIESDPTIAQEVIKVQKELTIMMAVDVITNPEKVAGPGAPALRKRAEEHLKRIGKSKFDPKDAYEFARRETFDGRSWMLVAPGVMCTAPHGSVQVSTPCALGQQQHNPANCKTGCEWQLLISGFEKTQADDTVDYALKNLQRALDEEDEAGIAMWKGQAKTWLYRHDEVADKWKNHPLVLMHVPRPLRVMMKEEA